MAKGNYYTPLGNGLWRDERTGAVGTLKVGRGGGFYVDAGDQSGTSREKFKKEQISQAYRDADDKVASFYRRKNKEGQLKKSSKEEDVRQAKKEANEKLAEAVEFGNLYNTPLQPLPGEYDINEFSKIDENAKTRMDRFAERNQIAENLKKWGQEEYNSDKLFILDRNVIEDEWGNTYVTNEEYGRTLNTEDFKEWGKRKFSPEEKVAGYRRRKGYTQEADDREIESDIKSLFTYQNEKNMGAGPEKDPMKKYYDKYGKENVDRVWADMDKKYAVIQGVAMDTEGLRYNELVEKDKYSPEAIQYYQNRAEQAWQNYYGDSSKYNAEMGKAKEEFGKFDSERRLEKEWTKLEPDDYDEDPEFIKSINEHNQRVLDKQNQKRQFADAIRQNKMDKGGEEWLNPTYSLGEYGKGLYVQFQDIEKHTGEDLGKYPDYKHVSDRVSSNTWARVWEGNENVLNINDSKYGARKQVIDYLEGKGKDDTTEKWSDTDKYEYDLYKRAKENPDSIDPMTENSTDWDALDKKWSNRYDYDKEQEEFGSKEKALNSKPTLYEEIHSLPTKEEIDYAQAQVERFKERKEPAYKNPDVQREVAKNVAKAFGADSVKVGGETIPISLQGNVNITEAPKSARRQGVTAEEYERAENNVARLKNEYNSLLREEENYQRNYNWSDDVDPSAELESIAYDRGNKEAELFEAQEKQERLMKKDGFMTRKQKFTSSKIDNIKAQVERYRKRKNK